MSAAEEELPHEAHLAALASLDGVGPGRLRWLLTLGAPASVWELVRSGALPLAPRALGASPEVLAGWTAQSVRIRPAAVWQRCVQAGVGVVSLGSAGYPPALEADMEPPVVLFHLGDPEVVSGVRVAIVGTRRATGYGLRVARELGAELSEAGVSVVSGLALGIDAAAHRGAVSSGGAPPIGVVGGGLDSPCPVRNRDVAAAVARDGVLMSEVPPGVAAAPWRFPVRNRILAALSDAVVVVESAGGGGSMHTVREAMSRDRPVLAVPGPIDSRASEGTNELISDGAQLCSGSGDVLLSLGLAGRTPVGVSASRRTRTSDLREPPHGDAATVLDALEWRPASMEQLALRSGLGFRELSTALTELERSGWVRRSGGWIERVAGSRTVRAPEHRGA